MKTHTIRNGKNGNLRIITFTPKFMEILLDSETYAIAAITHKLKKNLYELTGKEHVFDIEQEDILTDYCKAKAIKDVPYHTYRYIMIFLDGYHIQTLGNIIEDLELLNSFIRMIKLHAMPFKPMELTSK